MSARHDSRDGTDTKLTDFGGGYDAADVELAEAFENALKGRVVHQFLQWADEERPVDELPEQFAEWYGTEWSP